MLDVQRRRREEEEEERGGGGREGKGEKKRGQIDTEVKKHRGRKREQNQVEKLDRTFFFSSGLFQRSKPAWRGKWPDAE